MHVCGAAVFPLIEEFIGRIAVQTNCRRQLAVNRLEQVEAWNLTRRRGLAERSRANANGSLASPIWQGGPPKLMVMFAVPTAAAAATVPETANSRFRSPSLRHGGNSMASRRRRVLQCMDEECFRCSTPTLTTREVVTGRQLCSRKRKRFPRSTSPDSKTRAAAGVGQYSG